MGPIVAIALLATTAPTDSTTIRGMTISCQTWGGEWGTPELDAELDELQRLGVNWISIHPYARIEPDGSVRWRKIESDSPPPWLAKPIQAAHARGMSIMIKPHLAYWGSGFTWRGAIDFPDPRARKRFFATYQRWMLEVAAATKGADAVSVGTELDRLVPYEKQWRELIGEVRRRTGARLTYAANWTDYDKVPFWDALDAIGVQGYFPVTTARNPSEAELEEGWTPIVEGLRALSKRTGKPVVLTELGYDTGLGIAAKPWADGNAAPQHLPAARVLQARCLQVALGVLRRERDWLRGAFLWKWFVGDAPGENFMLDTPHMRPVIDAEWRDALNRAD